MHKILSALAVIACSAVVLPTVGLPRTSVSLHTYENVAGTALPGSRAAPDNASQRFGIGIEPYGLGTDSEPGVKEW